MSSPTTTVNLTVLTTHLEQAMELLAKHQETPEFDLEQYKPDGDTIEISFNQIRYGQLEGLKDLRDHGIAYDAVWSQEWDIEPGGEHCRFTEIGECVVTELMDREFSLSVSVLMELIDKPEALRTLIQERHEALQYASWDNQAEYGKRHQLHRLL